MEYIRIFDRTPYFDADEIFRHRVLYDDGKDRGRMRWQCTEVEEEAAGFTICAYCKKIRNDKKHKEQIESYISQHSKSFSHGICPDCVTGPMEIKESEKVIVKRPCFEGAAIGINGDLTDLLWAIYLSDESC
jgi:hypothetical protein